MVDRRDPAPGCASQVCGQYQETVFKNSPTLAFAGSMLSHPEIFFGGYEYPEKL